MMRNIAIACLTAVLSFGFMNLEADAQEYSGRGGAMGFFSGCLFGPRAAMDYNDGKEIHMREWFRLIPFAGAVFAILDGIDGSKGMTRADYVDMYGSTFY